MKNLVKTRSASQRKDAKGRLSSLQTTKTHVVKNGDMVLSKKEIGELLDDLKLGYDSDHLLEREKQYLEGFLKSIDCPFEITKEHPDYGAKSLLYIIKDSYDHIPGATDAAYGLNELFLCHKESQNKNHKKALAHALRAGARSRRVLFAGLEPTLKAGNSKTTAAHKARITEKERLVELVLPKYKELLTKKQSKESCYKILSNFLKGHGIKRSPSTIKGWLKSENITLI
jgi:hypothetical protein